MSRTKRQQQKYEANKRWEEKHPGKAKDIWREHTYGISSEEYNRLIESQNGRCKICGRHQSEFKSGRLLSIDHDHKTGKVRGLLCNNCNRVLGFALDNPVTLELAAKYLRES